MIFYIVPYSNYDEVFFSSNYNIEDGWYFCCVRFDVEDFGFSRTSFTSELLNSLLSDDIIYAIDKNEYLAFHCPHNIRSSSIVFANGNLVESQIQIDMENMVIEKRNLLLSRYNKPLIETKPCLISSIKKLKKFDSPAIKKMIKQGLIRCLYEWNFYGDILLYTKENGFYDSVIKILNENRLKYILCKSADEIPV